MERSRKTSLPWQSESWYYVAYNSNHNHIANQIPVPLVRTTVWVWPIRCCQCLWLLSLQWAFQWSGLILIWFQSLETRARCASRCGQQLRFARTHALFILQATHGPNLIKTEWHCLSAASGAREPAEDFTPLEVYTLCRAPESTVPRFVRSSWHSSCKHTVRRLNSLSQEDRNKPCKIKPCSQWCVLVFKSRETSFGFPHLKSSCHIPPLDTVLSHMRPSKYVPRKEMRFRKVLTNFFLYSPIPEEEAKEERRRNQEK